MLARVANALVLALAAAAFAFAQDDAPKPADGIASVPETLTALGGTLVFSADDGIHGRELWVREPTGFSRMLADLWPGPEGSNPVPLAAVPPHLYFAASTPDTGREVWLWNSATNQVQQLEETLPGPDPQHISLLGVSARAVLFLTNRERDMDIWAVPLGATTPARLRDLGWNAPNSHFLGVVDAAGRCIAHLPPGVLWQTDGTLAGSVELTQTPCQPGPESKGCFLGDRLLFVARVPGESGIEPWRYDPASGEITLLRDIHPGVAGSILGGLFPAGDKVYFQADDGTHGPELWVTGGEPGNTALLKDIRVGPEGSDPHYFCRAGSGTFFFADDGIHGCELWKLGDAPEGAALVCDIYPGENGSNAWSPVAFLGRLWFCAESPLHGEEIWVSDGTAQGTRLFQDLLPGPGSSGPDNLTVLGERLFFTCDDGRYGEELWMTDGTPEGTRLAADIAPPRESASAAPAHLAAWKGRVFFAANDHAHGRELWVSDGTEEGTRLVRDIAPGTGDANPLELTAAADALYFSAESPGTGRELWRTGGTAEETRLVRDLLPGPESGAPQQLTAFAGGLYFLAEDGAGGRSLWRVAGGGADAEPAACAVPGTVESLFEFEGKLCAYVRAAAGAVLCEFSDTEDAFLPVLEMPNAWSVAEPDAAWARAGGAGRTTAEHSRLYRLLMARPSAGLTASALGSDAAPAYASGIMLFPQYHEAEGAELFWAGESPGQFGCVTCGVLPGSRSSSPARVTVIGRGVYFSAESPESRRVLWHSTTDALEPRGVQLDSGAETYPFVAVRETGVLGDALLVATQRPGQFNSGRWVLGLVEPARPETCRVLPGICFTGWGGRHWFTPAGAQLFFVADDGIHDEELWVTDGTAAGTRLVKDIVIPR